MVDATDLVIHESYPLLVSTTSRKITLGTDPQTRSVLIDLGPGSEEQAGNNPTDPTSVSFAWGSAPTALTFASADDPAAADSSVTAGSFAFIERRAADSELHLVCNQGTVGAIVSIVSRRGGE